MQLDERSTTLLKEILLTPGIKISDLQKKLNISRYQVNYSLSKIDDWLESNQMPPLNKGRQSGLLAEQVVRETYPELIQDTSVYDYVISEIERRKLIILMLLIREEPFSLFHFSSALKVSRNTVLNDLKGAGELVKLFGLNLNYTRKDGYFIEGNELKKRQLIINLVHQMLQSPNGCHWFVDILRLDEEEINEIGDRLEKIEQRLKFRFTDENLKELPIILAVLIRRIRQKKPLETYYYDLLHTEEFKAVEELLMDQQGFDEKELLFLTLQLLSSSITSVEAPKEKGVSGLIEGIVRMLSNFEKLACVSLQEKDELVSQLYQHLKPAYYRIKYQLNVENPLVESVIKEHGELHHLVKKSVTPLEEVFAFEVPENELTYLTMLLGSWLLRQGEEISTKKMAIVVCPNGISVSKLLYETLRGLFPEIVFLDHISLRDFVSFPLEYDIVFSTSFLRTDKKLFLIKPLLSNEEKYRLKIRVYQELNKFNPANINLDELIDVIGQSTEIKDKDYLKKSLQDYFLEKQSDIVIPEMASQKPALEDLITGETVILREKASTWQDAFRIASQPLLDSMSIKPHYVDAMIQMFENTEPYIIIAPKVAIPHARPEDGVNRLSMSLLRLDEDVDFSGSPVRIFIVIAAIDRSTHLKALMQLNDLVGDPEKVKKIIEANQTSEILALIKDVCEN